jgi:hypothetical protein
LRIAISREPQRLGGSDEKINENQKIPGSLTSPLKKYARSLDSKAGVPDGRFPNFPIWAYFWNVKWWHTYFMVIWNILRPFGNLYGHLVYFSGFGMFYQENLATPRLKCGEKRNKSSKNTTATN